MASGRLLIPSWMPALDSDGDPIPSVKAYFYVNLTTTLAPVYANEALTVPLTNPVEANSSGRFPAIWADGDVLYSVAIEAPYGPAGVPFSYDNLSVSLGADIATAEAAEAAADDANAALADVLAAIEAATEAGGGDAALAGALAGATAGTAAANVVVAGKANVPLDNATRQRSATGAVALSFPTWADGLPPSPGEFGAAANGTTNDAAALQALVNAALAQKTPAVVVPRSYYINSVITVPRGVTIDGVSADGEWARDALARNQAGTLILGSSGGFSLSEGSALRRLNIVSSAASEPPSSLAAMVASIATWTGTAITVNGPDVTVDECLIMGFATGIQSNNFERWTLTRNKIDCLNGIDVANTYDTGRAQNNQIWPFYSAHRYGGDAVAGALSRSGKGIYVHDGADGSLITDNLIYGYQVGIDINGVYACHVIGNWIDNALAASATATAIGVRTQGSVRLCKIHNTHVDSHNINYALLHDAGQGIELLGNTTGQAITSKVRLGSGHGQIIGLTSAGNCATAEIEALSGCGKWVIDQVRVYGSTAPSIVSAAVADRPNLTISNISTISTSASYDARQFKSWVVAAKSADQTVPGTGVETALTYTESIDSLNEFNGATGVFTATTTGLYNIELQWGFTPSVGALHSDGIYFTLAGTPIRREQVVINGDGLRASVLTAQVWMTAGQALAIKATAAQDANFAEGFINSLFISRVEQ